MLRLTNLNEEVLKLKSRRREKKKTLGYSSDDVLRTLQRSTDEADVVKRSKRGKHDPKHKIKPIDEIFIKEHIKKYKLCISHY